MDGEVPSYELAISREEVYAALKPDLIDLLRELGKCHALPIGLALLEVRDFLPATESSKCHANWVDEDNAVRCLEEHASGHGNAGIGESGTACFAGVDYVSQPVELGALGRGSLIACLGKRTQGSPSEPTERGPNQLGQADYVFVKAAEAVLRSYVDLRYAEKLQRIRTSRGLSRLLHELANTSVYMELNAMGLAAHTRCGAEKMNETRCQRIRRYGDTLLAMAMEARYDCQNMLSAIAPDSGASVERQGGYESIDVMDLVREMWPSLEQLAAMDGLVLQFVSKAEEGVLDVHCPWIRVYPSMIRRALFNVFANAIKYSYYHRSKSERHRYIHVEATPKYSSDGTLFAVSVSNLGVGFANEEELRRATEFGFRGSLARAERAMGSGIGLAEVKRIMQLHGGHVRITSKPLGQSPALTVVWLVFRVPSRLKGRRGETA